MKRYFFMLMMNTALSVHAQFAETSINKNHLAGRFNATGLVDVLDMNLTLGAEKRLGNNLSLAIDAGWIFFSRRYDDIKGTNGLLLRPSVRIYPGKSQFYVEGEFHFKHVTYRIEDWLGRETVNGVPAYEQLSTFRLKKNVIGPHIKLGRQIAVFKNPNLMLDIYLGVGVHFRRYKLAGQPNGSFYNFRNDFSRIVIGETQQQFALPAGVRLIYKLDQIN